MAEKKVKCKVLEATVGDKGPGETISLDEKSAKYLESIGYVEIDGKKEEKKEEEKKEEE